SEDAEIRPAEAHRDPERLALPHHDVDAERAGWLEERVRVWLGDLDAERAAGVRCVSDPADVDEPAERVGVLHDEAGGALGGRREIARRNFDDLEIRAPGVGADGATELEVHLTRHHDSLAS